MQIKLNDKVIYILKYPPMVFLRIDENNYWPNITMTPKNAINENLQPTMI